MVKFMGNGLRISNVIQSLCSDCAMRIYHFSSKTSFCPASIRESVDFMIKCGYGDIFYLELEQVGEL